jgi:hypothetical protein
MSGAITRARRRLARPLAQPDELAQAARALLTHAAPVTTEDESSLSNLSSVSSLTLRLGDLSARDAAQPTPLFVEARAQYPPPDVARLERIASEIAAPLARRYGAPALYRLAASQPDAILPEDRAILAPLGARLPAAIPPAIPAATRAAHRQRRAAEGAGDVAPPQPHWW